MGIAPATLSGKSKSLVIHVSKPNITSLVTSISKSMPPAVSARSSMPSDDIHDSPDLFRDNALSSDETYDNYYINDDASAKRHRLVTSSNSERSIDFRASRHTLLIVIEGMLPGLCDFKAWSAGTKKHWYDTEGREY